MDGLTLATAVDHSLAAAALLELHLAGRLVQLVVLADRVGAAKEAAAQLLTHVIICIQYRARHAHTLIDAVLDKEVHYWRLAKGSRDTASRSHDIEDKLIHRDNRVPHL